MSHVSLSVADFLLHRCLPDAPACVDAHYTGPLEAQTTFGVGGSIHHEEGLVLFNLARTLGGSILEIGSDHGVSTRYLHAGLDASPRPSGKIIAVDFDHKWGEDDHWPRRLRLTKDSRRLLPFDVRQLLSSEDPALTFAFIDGDHSYESALRDLLLAQSLGIHNFAFHDISPNHPPYKIIDGAQSGSGVRELMLDLAKDPEFSFTEILTNCGMALVETV